MFRLPCLLATSSIVILGAACSDNASCGQAGSNFGLIVSSDQVSLNFGGLASGANNDCPDASAPAGVVSLTVTGTQSDGLGGFVTLCIPRPDQLAAEGALGTAVKIVDLTGTDSAGCTYTYDMFHPPTGTVKGVGVCANGEDPAGYGLVFDGFIGLKRTCAGTTDSVSVGISGAVAVTAH
ncbi:hypothetical protein BH11MYX1_BH11MYX1_01720 [soil metagenome]